MITKCPYGAPIDCTHCADNWNCEIYFREHLRLDIRLFRALLKEMIKEGKGVYWLARHFKMSEEDIRWHLEGNRGSQP